MLTRKLPTIWGGRSMKVAVLFRTSTQWAGQSEMGRVLPKNIKFEYKIDEIIARRNGKKDYPRYGYFE